MKKFTFIKRLSFVAVAGLLALTSCKKDSSLDAEESFDAQAIVVADATPSSDALVIIGVVPHEYSKDSIAASQLPAIVATYLTANYSGYTYFKTFKTKKHDALEGYVVVIKYNDKPIGLVFDASGNFVKVAEQRERGDLKGKGWKHGGRFDGRDGQHRDTIALTSLSTVIKTYFSVTYPKDTLLAAHLEKDGGIVVISANNGLWATLFNASNVFAKRSQIILHQGRKEAIAQASLIAKIANYLTTSYPAYVFHRAYAIKINSTTQAYVVLINSNDTKYALHFDASGNLVKTLVIK